MFQPKKVDKIFLSHNHSPHIHLEEERDRFQKNQHRKLHRNRYILRQEEMQPKALDDHELQSVSSVQQLHQVKKEKFTKLCETLQSVRLAPLKLDQREHRSPSPIKQMKKVAKQRQSLAPRPSQKLEL